MRKTSKRRSKSNTDPADGTHLSIRKRIFLCEEMVRASEKLTPFRRYRPFVKSFDSFQEYEKWRKNQTNPWLA